MARDAPTSGRDAPGPAPAKGRSELLLRVLSALVMAPVAIGAVWLGSWPFVVFWTLAAIGVAWEWTGLTAGDARRSALAAGVAALAAAAVAMLAGRFGIAVAAAAAGAVAAAAIAPAGRRLWTGAGIAYAGVLLLAPALLRADASLGLAAIIFLFAVVWATDIAAYFVGRAIGGPKLWPAVSPKKTWSGGIGGALAAVAAGLAVTTTAGLDSRPLVIALCLVLSAVSQAGDFLESAVKRHFGAKDASHLIPGHGGFMDRLDGFWAAALAAAVIGLARGGLEGPARGLLVW